ncbi:MAG: hypothetical protein ABSE81_06255 [Candidatus Omnitrophota bacterium]
MENYLLLTFLTKYIPPAIANKAQIICPIACPLLGAPTKVNICQAAYKNKRIAKNILISPPFCYIILLQTKTLCKIFYHKFQNCESKNYKNLSFKQLLFSHFQPCFSLSGGLVRYFY